MLKLLEVNGILPDKGESIKTGIYYITTGISYIIHTLGYNGTKAQRHNGLKGRLVEWEI
jgi:hypothetical protein